jgi:surface protein
MFEDASSFNQPLNSWMVGNVIDMSSMFQFATSFNQPLESWDVGSVVDMSWMFLGAAKFNQNLCRWYNVTETPLFLSMFSGSSCTNKSDPNLFSQLSFCGVCNNETYDEVSLNASPFPKPFFFSAFMLCF